MHMTRVLAVVLLTVSVQAQPANQMVLFVCEHGAAKSVVAAAHFNQLAKERGLPFRAIARGTAPDTSVPGRIAQGLKSEGLAVPAGYKPTLVSAPDATGVARVVTFDVTLPGAVNAVALERWDGLPAFSDGYAAASAAIAKKVDGLLRELQSGSKKQ